MWIDVDLGARCRFDRNFPRLQVAAVDSFGPRSLATSGFPSMSLDSVGSIHLIALLDPSAAVEVFL